MRHLILAIAVALSMAIGAAWAGDAVNINTASARQLQAVHGIGPRTASLIVDYRDEHGAFHSVDELQQVKGIGSKSLEKYRDELSVGSVAKD